MREDIPDLLRFAFGPGGGFRSFFGSVLFRRLFLVQLAQMFLEVFVAQALTPQLFGLIQIFRIRQLMAVDSDALVGIEVKFFSFEQFIHISDALLKTIEKAAKNLASRPGIGFALAIDRHVAEAGAIFFELGDIALQEVEMLRIERLDVAIKKLARNRSVERLLGVMDLLQ